MCLRQGEAELNSKLLWSGAAEDIFCNCTAAPGPPAPGTDVFSVPPAGDGAAMACVGIYRKTTLGWQENGALLWDCFIAKMQECEAQEITGTVILSIPWHCQLRQLPNGWTSSLKESLAFAKIDRKSYREDPSESVTTACRCQDG